MKGFLLIKVGYEGISKLLGLFRSGRRAAEVLENYKALVIINQLFRFWELDSLTRGILIRGELRDLDRYCIQECSEKTCICVCVTYSKSKPKKMILF